MPQIYVDGDACPVKAEVERVATRHGVPVIVVSNGGIRPSANPLVRYVTVDAGADAADNWIAENMQANDVVVTADIPLAARCLRAGARVLSPSGKRFTEDGIGNALGMREFQRYLREATGSQTQNPGFTRQDRSRFLDALENELRAAQRGAPARSS